MGEPVRNRDVWDVLTAHRDGSLTVSHRTGHGTLTLPADYVHHHVRLGYAAAEHGAQGDTVDVAIELVSLATTTGPVRGRHPRPRREPPARHHRDERPRRGPRRPRRRARPRPRRHPRRHPTPTPRPRPRPARAPAGRDLDPPRLDRPVVQGARTTPPGTRRRSRRPRHPSRPSRR